MPDRVPPISRFLYPASLSNTVYKCKVVKYRSSILFRTRARAMSEPAPAALAAPPVPRPSAGQGQGDPPPPRAASDQACSTERPPGPESARRADLPQTRPTHPQIYTLQPHRTSRYKPPRDRSPRHREGTESHHAPTLPTHPSTSPQQPRTASTSQFSIPCSCQRDRSPAPEHPPTPAPPAPRRAPPKRTRPRLPPKQRRSTAHQSYIKPDRPARSATPRQRRQFHHTNTRPTIPRPPSRAPAFPTSASPRPHTRLPRPT